jgi:hypothetical protein
MDRYLEMDRYSNYLADSADLTADDQIDYAHDAVETHEFVAGAGQSAVVEETVDFAAFERDSAALGLSFAEFEYAAFDPDSDAFDSAEGCFVVVAVAFAAASQEASDSAVLAMRC